MEVRYCCCCTVLKADISAYQDELQKTREFLDQNTLFMYVGGELM